MINKMYRYWVNIYHDEINENATQQSIFFVIFSKSIWSIERKREIVQEEDRPTFILNKLSSNLLDDISSQINTES